MPEDAPPLTLCQRLVIALVPASVPALVILIALGIAIGIGKLPEELDAMFEQVAGGALLITYIKELFPKVMEQGDAAVDSLTGKAGMSNIKCAKILCTLLMVSCISASAVAQAAAAGFPGIGSGDSDAPAFTPASTIAYFVGFFVDGVVLAYDDDPVRCDVTLVKKLIMSFVFAVDNLLDGFGLAPVLKAAFGDAWIPVMCSFSACVLAGGAFTAVLRWAFPSPVLHLIFISLSTTSILVGALQLTSHGLSVYVMGGVALVWTVLFIGDLVSEGGDEEAPEALAEPSTSLWSKKQVKFVSVAASRKKAQRNWDQLLTAGSMLSTSQMVPPFPPEVTPAQTLRERMLTAAQAQQAGNGR